MERERKIVRGKRHLAARVRLWLKFGGGALLFGCAPADEPAVVSEVRVAPIPAATDDSTVVPPAGAEPISAPTYDFTVVPGVRVGPITAATTEAELRELFGEAHVRAEAIEIGEGFTRPGLVIHPNDPARRLEILTTESDGGRIEEIRIRGAATMWRTERGIALGTTLAELETMNDGPLTLTGFGWDYGGTILDRRGGELTELGGIESGSVAGRTLLLRVEPAPGWRERAEYGEVLGDRDYGSDHPAMRALEPRVYEMTVIFPGP